MLKLLLALKPNIINLPLNDGDYQATALVWATHYSCQDIIQQLLDQSRTPLADVNARARESNNTALHEVITASEKFGSNDIFLQVVKTLLGTPGINLGFENSQDYTPIQLAIEKKLWKVVALLLPHYPAQQIADLKVDDLKALFFSAVKGGDTLTVRRLLEAKPALINELSPDKYQCSALIWAASYSNPKMVKLLLEMDGEKTVNQKDALDGNAALHEVISYGLRLGSPEVMSEIVTLLLETNDIDLTIKNKKGDTPLQLAIKKKLWDVAALLVAHYPAQQIADLVKLFFSAVKGGNTLTVRTFLEARPALINELSPDKYQCGVLIWAASYSNPEMVRLSLDMGGEKTVNQQDALDGNTALYEVIRYGLRLGSPEVMSEIVRLLLETNNIDFAITNNYGDTPIRLAIEKELWDAAVLLVAYYPAQQIADLRANDLKVLFFWVVEQGDIPTVQKLLEANPRLLNVREGKSALYLAAEKGDVAMLAFLIGKGADIYTKDGVDAPIYIAYKNGHNECIQAFPKLENSSPEQKEILLHEANERALKSGYASVLYLAAEANDGQSVCELVQMGATVYIHKQGFTALCQAVLHDNLTIAQHCLAAQGTEVNGRYQEDGQPKDYYPTPLLLAVAKGKMKTLALLLQQPSIDTNATWQGKSALYLAAEKRNIETVQVLIKSGAKVDKTINGILQKMSQGNMMSEGDVEVIRFLVDQGLVNINIFPKIIGTFGNFINNLWLPKSLWLHGDIVGRASALREIMAIYARNLPSDEERSGFSEQMKETFNSLKGNSIFLFTRRQDSPYRLSWKTHVGSEDNKEEDGCDVRDLSSSSNG